MLLTLPAGCGGGLIGSSAHKDVRRRSGALDLDVVEGLIVVVVPVGVALVTDTLLTAIACSRR